MGSSNRDNFKQKTIELIAKRAGFRCCCPDCRRLTAWPSQSSDKAFNDGEAAHICAASPGGPRYDASMTTEERTSADNGIWLCRKHAKMIDTDPETYTVEVLKAWKASGEQFASDEAEIGPSRRSDHVKGRTANRQFEDMFREPLFLHKEDKNTKVRLENLFVFQKFNLYYRDNGYSKKAMGNLEDFFREFISRDDKDVLFVEGDAGSGKTTLMAWLNHEYAKSEDVTGNMFQGRPLITIRLRDLEKREIAEKRRMASAVLKYMNVSSLDELEQLYPRAVMILDGFDELCMIEGQVGDNSSLLEDMFRKSLKDYKFIITTRPRYVNPERMYKGDFLFIQHFDQEKRLEWLNHYTSEEYCRADIEERIYQYILEIDDFSSSCILDTPMTLYMLAAKRGSGQFLDNSWALYHHIFHEELSETEYNQMFPDPERNYAHEIQILKEVLYQISEELAYRMYQGGNQRFYLTDETLHSIIDGLSESNPILRQIGMKEITKHCYALCCYWKENTELGAVEFLHNNIRDFFLAEKIYRELERMLNRKPEPSVSDVTIKFAKLFQYGVLDTKVAEFIYLRALYNRDHSIQDCARFVYRKEKFPLILSSLAGRALLSEGVIDDAADLTPIEIIKNAVTAAAQIIRYLCEPYLPRETEEGAVNYQDEKEEVFELIPWTIAVSENSSLLSIFRFAFSQVPVTITESEMIAMGSSGDFRDLDFSGCDLRNIDFRKSFFIGSDLSDTVLSGCDFGSANLENAKLNNADLHYASLKDAKLGYCDMTGCDLRGTDLPDGFVSLDQEEQVEHLRKLDIKGLKI